MRCAAGLVRMPGRLVRFGLLKVRSWRVLVRSNGVLARCDETLVRSFALPAW